MEYHGYEVDPEYIKVSSEGVETISWHLAGLGEYIVGTKNGARWFIKRNNQYRYLTEADGLDEDELEEEMAEPRKYQQEREKITELLVEDGGLTATRDHIVAEVEHFIADKRIVLVSPYVENIARDVVFVDMEAGKFIEFCRDVAILLVKIHQCGVIHGDLKVGGRDNVMKGNIIAAVEGGKLIPYLIDFDLSFPAPPVKNPDALPYSENYESPEIWLNIKGEESSEVTTATDIFTLGVVYHRLWTGAFPVEEDCADPAGACIAHGKPIKINKKFDVRIGDNCGATFMSLVNWMFAKDPAARPTAEQVVAVLQDEEPVPEEYHIGSDMKLFSDLWEAHKGTAERISLDELRAMGVRLFRAEKDGGSLKYAVGKRGGSEEILTLDEIVSLGYAKRKTAALGEPWPEHNIEFVSPERVIAKGYSSIQRSDIKPRYKIATITGVQFSHGANWLLAEGLATKKVAGSIDCEEPWPGDGKYAGIDVLSSKGVAKIRRGTKEHTYTVEYINRSPLNNAPESLMQRLGYMV